MTIAYASIGIPLLLTVLADLGKLFTRLMKLAFRFIQRFVETDEVRYIRQKSREATNTPRQVSALNALYKRLIEFVRLIIFIGTLFERRLEFIWLVELIFPITSVAAGFGELFFTNIPLFYMYLQLEIAPVL